MKNNEKQKPKSHFITIKSIKKSFSKRFEYLLDEKDIKNKEMKKLANISPSSVTEYIKEDATPSLVSLVNIAKGLGVSMDYLCGLNDTPSPDIEDIAINKKTGLSDIAISVLKEYNFDPKRNEIISIINFLLEQEKLTLAQQYFAYEESILAEPNLALDESILADLTEQDIEIIKNKKLKDYVQVKNKMERQNFIPIISTISDYFLTKDKKDKKISVASNLIPVNDKLYDISMFYENHGNFANEGVSYNEIVDFTYFRKVENKLKEAKEKYISDFQKDNDNQ